MPDRMFNIMRLEIAMLDNVETIFTNKEIMMKRLKKAGYITFMEEFRNEHGHFFYEMCDYVEEASDTEQALKEISDEFTSKVRQGHIGKFGKVSGKTQADLNLFMVFYVFPAILLTERTSADAICTSLCASWAECFPGNKIGYTTYDNLLPKFREKIFGIF